MPLPPVDPSRPPISNNDLLKAMKTIAIGDNPKTREMLYRALLDATLLVPITNPMGGEGDQVELEANSNVNVLMAQLPSGETALIAFTDEKALLQWRAQGNAYVGLHAGDFFPMAVQNGVERLLINPAGPVSGLITEQEIRALAEGLIPGTPDAVESVQVAGGSRMEVKIAPPEPHELPSSATLAHLRRVLTAQSQVAACYMFLLQIPPNDPVLAAGIVIDGVDQGAVDGIMRTVVSEVSPAIDHDREINFMLLGGSLLADVQQIVDPTFAR